MADAIHCNETPIEDNRFPITVPSSFLLCRRTLTLRIMRRILFSDRGCELQRGQFIGPCSVVEHSAFMGIPRWFGHVAVELNWAARRMVNLGEIIQKPFGRFTVSIWDQAVYSVLKQTQLELP